MNILILATHLNPGGISRYVIDLANSFSATEQVWVASAGGKWQPNLSFKGLKFKYIPIQTKSILSLKVLFTVIILFPFIIRNKIDIIHANTRVTQFIAFLFCKILGVRYVSSFHGFYKPHIFRKLFKFEGLRTIAVSEAVREHLVNDLGINRNKIQVVYNGIDAEEFQSSMYKKSDFGFTESDILLGVLGRISAEKGHFLVVDAFCELKDKYKNSYLLISGQGRLEVKLKDYVDSLGMAKRIRFMSLETKEFLDIIDVLLAASFKEGFGYMILEAFAKRVCVVGFSTGGIKEIIKDRQNGLLFYDYDAGALNRALESLLDNKALKETITRAAGESLAGFSLRSMVNKTKKVYQQVLS